MIVSMTAANTKAAHRVEPSNLNLVHQPRVASGAGPNINSTITIAATTGGKQCHLRGQKSRP